MKFKKITNPNRENQIKQKNPQKDQRNIMKTSQILVLFISLFKSAKTISNYVTNGRYSFNSSEWATSTQKDSIFFFSSDFRLRNESYTTNKVYSYTRTSYSISSYHLGTAADLNEAKIDKIFELGSYLLAVKKNKFVLFKNGIKKKNERFSSTSLPRLMEGEMPCGSTDWINKVAMTNSVIHLQCGKYDSLRSIDTSANILTLHNPGMVFSSTDCVFNSNGAQLLKFCLSNKLFQSFPFTSGSFTQPGVNQFPSDLDEFKIGGTYQLLEIGELKFKKLQGIEFCAISFSGKESGGIIELGILIFKCNDLTFWTKKSVKNLSQNFGFFEASVEEVNKIYFYYPEIDSNLPQVKILELDKIDMSIISETSVPNPTMTPEEPKENINKFLKIEGTTTEVPYVKVFGRRSSYFLNMSLLDKEGGVERVIKYSFDYHDIHTPLYEQNFTIFKNDLVACLIEQNYLVNCIIVYPNKVFDVLDTDEEKLLIGRVSKTDGLKVYIRTYKSRFSSSTVEEYEYPISTTDCLDLKSPDFDLNSINLKFSRNGKEKVVGSYYTSNKLYGITLELNGKCTLELMDSSAAKYNNDDLNQLNRITTGLEVENGKNLTVFYGDTNKIYFIEDGEYGFDPNKFFIVEIPDANFKRVDKVWKTRDQSFFFSYIINEGDFYLKKMKYGYSEQNKKFTTDLETFPKFSSEIYTITIPYEPSEENFIWIGGNSFLYKTPDTNPLQTTNLESVSDYEFSFFNLKISPEKNSTYGYKAVFASRSLEIKYIIDCHPDCKSCQGNSSNQCLSCTETSKFVNQKTRACEQCHSSCKTCSWGPFEFRCNSCTAPAKLDSLTRMCYNCSSNCASCSGPGPKQCVICESGFYLEDGECVSSCTGYVSSSNPKKCLPCAPNCASCSSSNTCSPCSSGENLVYSTSGPQICSISSCFSHQQYDPGDDICQPCHSSCDGCTGPGERDCISCASDAFSYKGECFESCPQETTSEPADKVCVKCATFCKECKVNRTDCTEAYDGYYFLPGKSGTYGCSSKCKSCELQSTNCTSCYEPLLLETNNTCAETCSDGKWADKTNGICSNCSQNCLKCTSDTDCTLCDEGYLKLDGKCVSCYKTCETCVGPNNGECLSCKKDGKEGEKFFLTLDNKCIRCHSSCKTCFDVTENSCLSCNIGYRYLEGDKTCILSCSDGTFLKEEEGKQTCALCHSSCLTCDGSGEQQCSSCKEREELKEGRCVPICRTSEFLNTISNKCENCPSSCKECSGSGKNQCLSCSRGYEYVKQKRECLKICSSNTFRDEDGSCEKCHNLCLQCFGPKVTECYQCTSQAVYVPEKKYCSPKCKEGSFPVSDNCLKCHESCKTCLGHGENSCTSCRVNFQLSKQNTCDCDILNGFFKLGNDCSKCHYKCKTCIGKTDTECTKCQEEYIESPLEDQKVECKNVCDKGSFKDKKLNKCLPCHEYCSICFGEGSNSCNICSPGYKLKDSTECVKDCNKIDKYTLSPDEKSCMRCFDDECLRCDPKKPGFCTRCSNDYFLYEENCIKKCPTGYVGHPIQPDDKQCLKCPDNCVSCKVNIEELTEEKIRTDCITCKFPYNSHESTCLLTCPLGYVSKDIKFGVSRYCEEVSCQPECEICRNQNHCEKCKLNYNSYLIVNIGYGLCVACSNENGLEVVKDKDGKDKCLERCGDGFLYGNIFENLEEEKNNELMNLDKTNWMEVDEAKIHECDDGNQENGDGCNSQCRIERGFSCTRGGIMSSKELKNLRNVPDECFEATKSTLERDTLREDRIAYYLSFNRELNDFSLSKFKKYFHLNFEPENLNKNNTVIPRLMNETSIKEKKIYIKLESMQFKKKMNGYIVIRKNEDDRSVKYQIKDVKSLPVTLNGTKIKFEFDPSFFLGQVEFQKTVTRINKVSESSSFQTSIFLASLNPIYSDLSVNILQKFVYYRLIKIKYPKNIIYLYKLFGTSWSTKSGSTDYDSEAKRSQVDKILNITSEDQNPPSEFKELRYSDLYVKACLPIFLVIFSTYLLGLCLNIIRRKRVENKLKLLKEITEEDDEEIVLKKISEKQTCLSLFIDDLIDFLREKLVWNGVIRSNLLAYQNFTVGLFLNLINPQREGVLAKVSTILAAFSIVFIFCNVYLYISVIENAHQKKKTENKRIEKFGKDVSDQGEEVIDNNDGTLTLRKKKIKNIFSQTKK